VNLMAIFTAAQKLPCRPPHSGMAKDIKFFDIGVKSIELEQFIIDIRITATLGNLI
jgi:hypothetical protein